MCAINNDVFYLHLSKAILSQVFLKSLIVICLTIVLLKNWYYAKHMTQTHSFLWVSFFHWFHLDMLSLLLHMLILHWLNMLCLLMDVFLLIFLLISSFLLIMKLNILSMKLKIQLLLMQDLLNILIIQVLHVVKFYMEWKPWNRKRKIFPWEHRNISKYEDFTLA